MRFFFHIVDKYGLSPDGIGCDHTDQDAAILHAQRIAAELARAGEFFRYSVVFVARAAVPEPASCGREPGLGRPHREDLTAAHGAPARADFLPLLPTENP
ncbi:DUF6894 family protein [Bradyrhizobium liaoningense]|uniref:DUF6894 family protein n=1 Tax=Bradyrhizobium liaoningense TaxID=43992 RepID=UPI001BA47F26|nr:hypothetical protein [Bradyrhizobium liaoningense]MBR0712387.1 hypothetical protein [Bradyrhizobium liaoningense]